MAIMIRESHLKRAPFGILENGLPLIIGGSLVRYATAQEANREANRRKLALGHDCIALPLDSMPGIRVYGMEHVLHSSGAN
jgi:hypothetical protein